MWNGVGKTRPEAAPREGGVAHAYYIYNLASCRKRLEVIFWFSASQLYWLSNLELKGESSLICLVLFSSQGLSYRLNLNLLG